MGNISSQWNDLKRDEWFTDVHFRFDNHESFFQMFELVADAIVQKLTSKNEKNHR